MLKYRFILLAMICSASQLEHIYFLTVKKVLPCSAGTASVASLYSCRAWAVYTLLHFGHLWQSLRQLRVEEERAIKADREVEKAGGKRIYKRNEARRAALMNGLVVNLAYAPLTLHW